MSVRSKALVLVCALAGAFFTLEASATDGRLEDVIRQIFGGRLQDLRSASTGQALVKRSDGTWQASSSSALDVDYLDLSEIADPGAPSADTVRLWAEDPVSLGIASSNGTNYIDPRGTRIDFEGPSQSLTTLQASGFTASGNGHVYGRTPVEVNGEGFDRFNHLSMSEVGFLFRSNGTDRAIMRFTNDQAEIRNAGNTGPGSIQVEAVERQETGDTTVGEERYGTTALTDESSVELVRLSVPQGTGAGGTLELHVWATDGSDLQMTSEVQTWSVINNGGTIQSSNVSNGGEATQTSTGTLTLTVTFQEPVADTVSIGLNANTSLASTTTFRARWSISTDQTGLSPQ